MVAVLALAVGAQALARAAEPSRSGHVKLGKKRPVAKKKKHRRVCRRHERPHGRRPCLRPSKGAIRPRGVRQQGGPNDVVPLPTTGGLGGGPDGFDKEENAIEWARGLRGNHLYAWHCESFVENAFNVADKFDTAFDAWQALPKHDGAPPRGALVFFKPDSFNSNYGHVGISTGGWSMISALETVRETDISDGYWRKQYLGWSPAPASWPGRRVIPGKPNPNLEPGASGPSVQLVSPSMGDTLTGTVTLTARTTNASGVEFDAYYADDPGNVNTVSWHKLGLANTSGDGTWTMPYDTHAIPDQGNPQWFTVNVQAIALDGAGNQTAGRDYRRVNVSNAVTLPPPPPPPATHSEQQGSLGANTFTNPFNASGQGQKIQPNQTVEVSCKVYAPQIASANPDGYWYRIASAPWSNSYYAVANTFWNGDIPGHKPYTHNTDFAVPDC
jgi:hypothetical protein